MSSVSSRTSPSIRARLIVDGKEIGFSMGATPEEVDWGAKGIDLMIDGMIFLGISVADSAKTAERVMAITMFLVGGGVAGSFEDERICGGPRGAP